MGLYCSRSPARKAFRVGQPYRSLEQQPFCVVLENSIERASTRLAQVFLLKDFDGMSGGASRLF